MASLELRPNNPPEPYRPHKVRTKAEPSSADEQEEKDELARRAKLHEQVIKRTNLSASAFAKQREQELEDLQFDRGLPEDQWLPDFLSARKGGIGKDGRYTPPRPTLTIPKQDQPVQQILSEARAARFSIRVKPGPGRHASVEGARVRQELYRAVEVDSRAWMARMWALDRAVKCGRGAYRVNTVYARDRASDPPDVSDFDHKIVIDRILNQHGVYDDPFARQPDFSDREFLTLTTDLPEDKYLEQYGTSQLAKMSADQIQGVGDSAGPGWITADAQGKKAYRIAEHYWIEHDNRVLAYFKSKDGSLEGAKWLDEIPEGSPEDAAIVETREVDERRVKWCVVNGVEVLDEETVDTKYIPVVIVVGKEYNVGGDRSYQGVITKSKDAQRSYNVMRSEQVTLVGLVTKAPWIMAEGQDEDYEEMWDDANTRYFTRIYYKPKTHEGLLVPPPQRANMAADIGSVTQLAREAEADVKSTTGREDPSLGRLSGKERSGSAIRALQQQGETTSSVFADNLAMIAMTYEAKVVLDWMQYVYDRQGRIERALGDDPGDERLVMLNQPYLKPRDKGGVPQPLPPGTPFDPDAHEHYVMTQGEYGAVVEVGKQLQNQREEDSEFLQALAEAAPQLVPLFADLWVGSLESPFAKRIAERIKKANPALADENEDGQPQTAQIPPAAQAQMQQMQQQAQTLLAELQKLKAVIDGKQVETKSRERIAAAEIASKERIADATVRASLIIEEAKLKTDRAELIISAELDHIAQRFEHTHARVLAGMAEVSDASTQLADQAHAITTQAADQGHEAAGAAADRAAAARSAAVAAAQVPGDSAPADATTTEPPPATPDDGSALA